MKKLRINKIAKKSFFIAGDKFLQFRYKHWLRGALISQNEIIFQRKVAKKLTNKPLISIIVPTYNTPERFLCEMVESVLEQTYDNWELILIDDNSTKDTVRKLILDYSKKDKRVHYKFLKTNHHIAGATNHGIKLSEGEFIALLDHDDLLQPDALFEIVRAINSKNLDFIYSDEDKIKENSRVHLQPFFKPDWNQDFLYSINYITHFVAIRKNILEEIGGLRSEYNGAQDWELFLRIARNIPKERIHHIPKILYHWRIHDFSTSKSTASKPYVVEAQKRAIADDLVTRGYKNFQLFQDKEYPGQWQVSFENLSRPTTTLIITNDSIAKQVKNQIIEHTKYTDYKIITLNQNAIYADILGKEVGEFIVFIDRKLKINDPNWLIAMAGDAIRTDIGFVLSHLNIDEEVINNVASLIDKTTLTLIRSMSNRVVSKHYYLTSRYNIDSFNSGVAMIETKKLLNVIGDENKLISLADMSESIIRQGYRNLYNPYIKVARKLY